MERLEANGFHFYAGGRKWLARGITYGPFSPDEEGHCYPGEERLEHDFAAIAALGINVLRLYTLPSEAFARLADKHGLRLLVDVSWPKHLDVYERQDLQDVCLAMVDETMQRIASWPNLMGVLLGNEIPADLVRWAGATRVEKFLRALYHRAKSAAPHVLVGFSNYPSTEYLSLQFFDFIGFNVYLHEPHEQRSYFLRLRHLYPDQPLVLSETGVDTQGNGEEEQARVLRDSLQTAFEVGMAGAFVFSWTDEWFTGGYDIEDWSFGIVDAGRQPKLAAPVVRKIYRSAPQAIPLENTPRISVVVATYNGASTLRGCLDSLKQQRYPDYEIVVVDDGSTDDTASILAQYDGLVVVSQENRGLSAARNAGIQAARGDIVAFTDSDCVADPDWLYHIALALTRSRLAGVGGPNLTPREENPLHRCVGYAPGHATHVLLDEELAEHVPGCNMAFWRHALLAVDCFDPQYRKAGDDVDVIWRLQDRGYTIGFAPGAFVWHHRRSSIGAYLRQQRGYGEAEALLLRKHPQRFNDRGQSLWRGVIYSGRDQARIFDSVDVHYGVFGSAGYQCIYQRREGWISHFVVSLEWWLICAGMLAIGLFSRTALIAGLGAMALSLGISGLKARRRFFDARDLRLRHFFAIWSLWILQPIMREGSRYWAHLTGRVPSPQFAEALRGGRQLVRRVYRKSRVMEYWGEKVPDRIEVLRHITRRLAGLKWIYSPNSGWEPWDLSVVTSWWFKVLLTTAEEDHGENRRLMRIRFRIVPSSLFWVLTGAGLLLSLLMALHDTVIARVLLMGFIVTIWLVYRQALHRRCIVQGLADAVISDVGYSLFNPPPSDSRHEVPKPFLVTEPSKGAPESETA